jgi:AcrR family transcriptional regulator
LEIHKRAVSQRQKNEKTNLILQAAQVLLAKLDYDSVSMVDIAHQAGLAKGTLYLYFKTKETLFLSLTEVIFNNWFDEIDHAINDFQNSMTAELFANIIATSLDHHPLLLKLILILHITLEHQTTRTQAYVCKKKFLNRMEETGKLLEKALAYLPEHKGFHLLILIYTFLIGLQHMSMPADIVQLVLESSEISPLKIDLRTELKNITVTLLKGWETNQ